MNPAKHYKYFYKQLPLSSQLKFYAAAFCTFAPLWAISVSRFAEQRSWLEVVAYFVLSGSIAVGYAFAFTQNKKFFAVVIPLHIVFWSGALFSFIGPLSLNFTVTGLASMVFIIAGYILFAHFIQVEGANSMRLQTEIDLAQQLHEHLVPPITIALPWVSVHGVSFTEYHERSA